MQAIHLYRDPNGEHVFGDPTINSIVTATGGKSTKLNIPPLTSSADDGMLRQQVDELEEALRQRDAVIEQFQHRSGVQPNQTVM